MSTGTQFVALVSAFCIQAPSTPATVAQATVIGPPVGAVVQLVPATPIAASLGNSVGKATDITAMAKKAKRTKREKA